MKIATFTPVTSTFDGAEPAVECTFDPDGAAHLMSVLSNMYRNKSLAVLREYSANARDAHIQAGNPDPVEITLPTEWNPELVVKDHGVGLNRDEILAVYSKYGPSTKRDGNDQVGGFGIGAKSAFTLASQFTVTAAKDGITTIALFSLNEKGVGAVKIVSQTHTGTPNGVTISVAVDDATAMRRAAATLFSTWPPGTVLVDGEPPHYLPDTMLQINDTLYARHRAAQDTDERTGITLVMGGIPYQASEPMLRAAAKLAKSDKATRAVLDRFTNPRSQGSLHLLALVPIGDVDITPSREDLRDTPRTIAMLARITTDFVRQRAAAAKRVLDTEPTAMHASLRLTSLGKFLMDMTASGAFWRDQWLAPELSLPFLAIKLDTDRAVNRTESTLNPTVTLGTSFDNTVVITDVDDDARKTVKRLANRFMTHTGTGTLILAPNTEGKAGWFAYGGEAPIATLTFTDFKAKAVALPKVSATRTTTYHAYTASSRREMTCQEIADAVAVGCRVLYTPQPYSTAETQLATDALLPTDLLIILYGTQTEKALHKRFPQALAATPMIHEHARSVLASMTTQERLGLEFDHRTEALVGRITHHSKLYALEPVRKHVDRAIARRDAYDALSASRCNYLRQAQIVVNRHSDTPPEVDRSTGFPLLDMTLQALCSNGSTVTYCDAAHEHLTRYLDAVRATELAA